MAQSIVLTGANIRLYVNNKIFNTVQNINFVVDYGETEIYGIDSPYPQEIAPGKITVRGTISCIRVKNSGGLQASKLRPTYSDFAASPYISLRINDRSSNEDILFIPNCKVTKETHTAGTKQTYKLVFDFVGQIPLFALDRS